MTKRIRITAVLCGLALLATLGGCASGHRVVEGAAVSTANWETHAMGRFLIDLPPNAECHYSARLWDSPIKWRKDLTLETMIQEAENKIKEYESTPHQKFAGKTLFIERVALPGGGVAIQHWNHSYSTELSVFDAYFISPDDEKRVFYYTLQVDVDHFALGKQAIIDIANSITSREEYDPLPTEPGFVFEGGFSRHTGEWRAERSIVAFALPDHPGIKGYFACYGFGKKQQFMFEREGNEEAVKEIGSRATILRKGDCSLNGIPGQEIGFAITEKGRRKYLFDMEAPGQGPDIGRPMLVLHLETDETGTGDGFSSDKEAVGVWDAIRNSIRLRPGAV